MEKSGELSANGQEKAIAWKQHPGISPGVVFLGGFRSDMEGGKVVYLASRLASAGRSFTRFDYRGHGRSSGHYTDYTVTDWLEDVLAVIDRLTEGPLVRFLHCQLHLHPTEMVSMIALALVLWDIQPSFP